MRRYKRANESGTVGTALNNPRKMCGHDRRKTRSRPAVLAWGPDGAELCPGNAGSTESRLPPAPAPASASPPRPIGLFVTGSGLDITPIVMEVLWLALEREYLTMGMVQESCSVRNLTSEDQAAVWQKLWEAGVVLGKSAAVESDQSATCTAAEGAVDLKTKSASVQNEREKTEPGQLPGGDAETALPRQMAEADREMRQIYCRSGFAAHEHVVRAKNLLAHPSEEAVEHLVADSEVQSHSEYLKTLPKLIEQASALDQEADAAYREWREAKGQPDGRKHQFEFGRLECKLERTLAGFCYQTRVIQEMMAFAQSIDAQFRASQRALRQAALRHGSVCQMPRVDVEMQTIERLEELVRMPCEMFLRNYFLSNMAAWRFRQARRDLIEDHLHLVASIAVIYSNRGLTLPRLVREGIAGLIRAVEKFGNRLQWSFSTYAACWIRESICDALSAQASPRRGGPASGGSRRPHERGHPARETILGRPVI